MIDRFSSLENALRTTPSGVIDDAIRVLDRACDVLDRDGWCRQTELDEHGRRCARGAIRQGVWETLHTSSYTGRGDHVMLAALMAMFHEIPCHSQTVTRWNDYDVRDKHAVQRVFRRAARHLRKLRRP